MTGTGQRVGSIVDRRYAVRREIARGGVGTVFEAEHVQMRRAVALKCLHDDHVAREESRGRLRREAAILGKIHHAGVVLGLDAGSDEAGAPFLVMELLEGRSLEGVLSARGRLPLADVAHVGRQAAEALGAAHARGVVHRDVKPGNLFLAVDDAGEEVVKLLDFGIAAHTPADGPLVEPKLTQQDQILGTPEYMAPERLLAQDVPDPRADVYSLGVTLYELLTGAVPFEGTYGEVLLRASTTDAPPLSRRGADVPPAVERVIARAVARAPEERFADGRELAAAWVEATGAPAGRSRLISPAADAAPAGTEQRRFRRAPYVTPVRLIEGSGAALDGHSEDLSEGGLLVLLPRAFAADAVVRVRFALPITGRVIDVSAMARWKRSARGVAAAGLAFEDVAEDARTEIRRYVELMSER